MVGSMFTFWLFEGVPVSSGFLGVDPADEVSGPDVVGKAAVVVVGVAAAVAVDGGAAGGGCGRGEVGSRITGFVTGGPSGVVLYRFPFGLRIPIALSLLRTTSTQSSITSRELQANLRKRVSTHFFKTLNKNLIAAVSKLMTKLHSLSAGMSVGEM